MWRRLISSGYALSVLGLCLVLCGCGQLIGASDVDYSLEPGAGAGSAGESGVAGGSGGRLEPAPASSGRCAGDKGPTPVNIDGLFCVDSTEVTSEQYIEFLDAGVPLDEQPADCIAWNDTYEPDAQLWVVGTPTMTHPVTGMDWCDAWAYCHWAGKRLCNGVGGGDIDWNLHATDDAELYYACSESGKRAFPYGNVYDDDACVTTGLHQTYPVATFEECEGGYAGLFDMSGNVNEWQALCRGEVSGSADECRTGAAAHENPHGPSPSYAYSCANNSFQPKGARSLSTGIRCCSDPL